MNYKYFLIGVIDTKESFLQFLMSIKTKSHILLNLRLIKIPHALSCGSYHLIYWETFIFEVLLLAKIDLLGNLFNHLILLAEGLNWSLNWLEI